MEQIDDSKIDRSKVIMIVIAAVVITYFLTPKVVNNYHFHGVIPNLK